MQSPSPKNTVKQRKLVFLNDLSQVLSGVTFASCSVLFSSAIVMLPLKKPQAQNTRFPTVIFSVQTYKSILNRK